MLTRGRAVCNDRAAFRARLLLRSRHQRVEVACVTTDSTLYQTCAFDRGAKILRGFKNRNVACRNLQFFVGAWIPGRACRAMLHLERPEAAKLDQIGRASCRERV